MCPDTPTDTTPKGSTYVYKVVLIGDGAVGKTNLRRRYMGESFTTEYMSTVGADFAYFNQKIDGNEYKWSIWDLAGQPKFSNVRPVFYNGAFGALLCFDSTRKETFENLDKWVDELVRHTTSEGTPIVVVACKLDIYDEETHVSFDEIKEYLEKLTKRFNNRFNISLVKTSAITGLNVQETFENLRLAIGEWVIEEQTFN